jgi:hypothetical protein
MIIWTMISIYFYDYMSIERFLFHLLLENTRTSPCRPSNLDVSEDGGYCTISKGRHCTVMIKQFMMDLCIYSVISWPVYCNL